MPPVADRRVPVRCSMVTLGLALAACTSDTSIFDPFPIPVTADDTTLTDSCQGSFSTPLAGGGLYQLGADSVRYAATRVVLSVCLAPNFECDVVGGACEGGADALLLVSTAVRPIVLSRTTYR